MAEELMTADDAAFYEKLSSVTSWLPHCQRVLATYAAYQTVQGELDAIALAFGNPLALDGLTLPQKAAKCVAMLAKLNAPADLPASRPQETGESNA